MESNTKNTVQKIPLLTVRAGPRDGEKWIERLKEEYTALIKVNFFFQHATVRSKTIFSFLYDMRGYGINAFVFVVCGAQQAA